MSTSDTSAVGMSDSRVQDTASVACPELPALGSACNKLVDLICSALNKILPVASPIINQLKELLKNDVLHLKEHMLNTIAAGRKDFSTTFDGFLEAKNIKNFFKALGNVLQWALGKGFYGLAIACTKVLGWLIALNDATINQESIKEWLTGLKRDFETVVNFVMGPTGVILSAEKPQTDERQVAITGHPAPVLQLTTSLAEKSDATHDVKTREQHILEQIQRLIANEDVLTTIQQAQFLETESDMISFLLTLVDTDNTPERLLIIVSNLKVPQSA
ncbi:MAG: hypothetical protein LBE99_01800 [Puniceicoccales bacterium]|nr:hypothetical protein [Puniceicoccales bacterium]